MTTIEITENNTLIANFMDCEVIESYKSPTMTMYSVKGKFIQSLRKAGFKIGGLNDVMMLDNFEFHTSYDWLMLVVRRIHEHPDCPSGIFIDDRQKRCYHEKGNKIFEGETTLEALLNIVLYSIRWLQNKEL